MDAASVLAHALSPLLASCCFLPHGPEWLLQPSLHTRHTSRGQGPCSRDRVASHGCTLLQRLAVWPSRLGSSRTCAGLATPAQAPVVVSRPGGCEVQWLTRAGLWDWTVAFIEAVGESEDF